MHLVLRRKEGCACTLAQAFFLICLIALLERSRRGQ